MGRLFRVGEVARLTRISIRTLHHYDRIGLVRPTARSEAGYRLYAEEDLLRLQQVLTLRYLGFPLQTIGEILARPDFDLIASLRIQREAIRDRMTALERIDTALSDLLGQYEKTGEWDWESVISAAAAVQHGPAQGEALMEAYYTPEQMEQFAELGKSIPREEIAAIEEAWTALLAEVRENRDLDPTDPRAQALATRWDELMERTTGHYQRYPELLTAIGENIARGAFEGYDLAPQQADFAFIERVKATRANEHDPPPAAGYTGTV